MVNDPKISVIIPTLRRPLPVRDLLASIERQICSVPFEVIVVSNLPEKGLKKTVESFGRNFRYFETGRLGVNIARNKGLEKARAPVVLFLDDDCYLQSREYLQKTYNRHETHPDAVGIGGRYSLKPAAGIKERAYHWIVDHRLTANALDRNHSQSLIGGNCSFKRRLLGRLLHFNEAIVFGGADVDLFARITKAGYKLMLFDELTVEHRTSMSLFDFVRKSFWQGYSAGVRERVNLTPDARHWNSTLTVEQNMMRSGLVPDERISRYFAIHRKVFEFGRLMSKKGEPKAGTPPLLLRDYVKSKVTHFKSVSAPSFFHRFYLLLNRSLAIAPKK